MDRPTSNPYRPTPDGRLRSRAMVYLQQSSLDLKEAKRLFLRDELVSSVFHSVQAGVNALTAVSLAGGRTPLSGASPTRLLQACVEKDQGFLLLAEPCQQMEQASGINPFGTAAAPPVISKEQTLELLEAARAIFFKADQSLMDHKSFFGKVRHWMARRVNRR